METGDYRWMRHRNGIGVVAIVNISVSINKNACNEIIERYNGSGFTGQGCIESVPKENGIGYDTWKVAARNGLLYAMSLTSQYWTVVINKVEGIAIINTNPTVVGYTAMRAFLEQVGISLDAVQEQRFEALISESRTEPTQNFVPDFFSNTLSEMK